MAVPRLPGLVTRAPALVN